MNFNQLSEGRHSLSKTNEQDKEFALKQSALEGNVITNMTIAIRYFRKRFYDSLAGILSLEKMQEMSLPELDKILKKNKLELKKSERGAKPKSSTYKDDKAWLADNGEDNSAIAISAKRNRLLKTLQLNNYDLIDFEKKSLAELDKIVKDNKLEYKTKRKNDWKIAESDIAAGVNNLFLKGFFILVKKDKSEVKLIGGKSYSAKVKGGAVFSDVVVLHKTSSGDIQEFYIESKLNFETAEYFKFGLKIVGDKITYDHKKFLEGDVKADPKQLKAIDNLFKDKIDLSGFLNEILNSEKVKTTWKKFLLNVNDIVQFLKSNVEWKQFAEKMKLNGSYPNDFIALAEAFDMYKDHYIQKYNQLIDQLFEMIKVKDIKDRKEEFYILRRTKSDKIAKGSVFKKIDNLIAELWDYSDDKSKLFTDKNKFFQITALIKKIEAKFSAMLDELGKDSSDISALNNLKESDKLKYFFKMFLSSVGRKKKNEDMQMILADDEDKLGNMQLMSNVIIETSKLSKMIADFYVLKDNCAYVQIDKTVYQFYKDFNPFNLPKLPVFTEHLKKFSLGIHVSDELDKISLKLSSIAPDLNSSEFSGKNLVSFKEKDANYLLKTLKSVKISLNNK